MDIGPTLTSLYSKLSTLSYQCFYGNPPDSYADVYPRCVYKIATKSPEKTFSEDYACVEFQFNLQSSSGGLDEITTMYSDLNALLDETILTITGYRCEYCKETLLVTDLDYNITTEGTTSIKEWAVTYEIKILKL